MLFHAKFTGSAAERSFADKVEGLVVGRNGIGVDVEQGDLVMLSVHEVGDVISTSGDAVVGVLENESVGPVATLHGVSVEAAYEEVLADDAPKPEPVEVVEIPVAPVAAEVEPAPKPKRRARKRKV